MSVRGLDPLSVSQKSGVSKTKKKALSAKQKRRRQLAVGRAESVLDMLETKVSNSKHKGDLIKERKKDV